MHVTQSALSLLLRELESELGFRLLDRNSRNTQLSVMGAEFYPLAVKVIDDLDNAVHSTLQLHERQRGSVRVACTLLYSQALMPEILAMRSEEHTSELQSLMRISYAVFCLKKKRKKCQQI